MTVKRNYLFVVEQNPCMSMDALSDIVASIPTSIEANDWNDSFVAFG